MVKILYKLIGIRLSYKRNKKGAFSNETQCIACIQSLDQIWSTDTGVVG